MKFAIVALFAGLAAAGYAPQGSYPVDGGYAAPSSVAAAPHGIPSEEPCEDEYEVPKHESAIAPKPHPTPAPEGPPAGGKHNETCGAYTETCTVTVTIPKKPFPAANSTAVAAVGTGTAATPTKAYYSNAANAMNGGAFVVGAGALAALFL